MIEIVPYDPAWPSLFDAETALIRNVMGKLALRVEHVGSTAVPGLAAKPAIAIQVSAATLDDLSAYLEPPAQIGYSHISLGPFDLDVKPSFRRRGIGRCAAHELFARFGGTWQIRARDTDHAARAFWREAIPHPATEQASDGSQVTFRFAAGIM